MKKLQTIQHLRAVAALSVVGFHAAEKGGTHFIIGAAGVDIFFVISGFIMWVIAADRPITPGRFMRDRIERIVPLYWVATTVMVLGGLAGLFPRMTLTLEHVVSSYLFVPHLSPSTGQPWPVLVQGWTLNYEMFFYILFAGILFLQPRLRLASLIGMLCACVAAGALFQPQGAVLSAYTDPILLEFGLGMLVGAWWLKSVSSSRALGIGLVIAGLCGFAFVGATLKGLHPFVLGPLGAMLMVGALMLERAGSAPRLALLGYLGDCSYSIYLWHTLAMSVVFKVAALLAVPAPAAIAIAILAGTAIGIASYEFLERPMVLMLKGLRAGAQRPRPMPMLAEIFSSRLRRITAS
ncbi:acyltransferase family protein [Mesorhizobium xinjiangense]|uniref:acyltransferase family protein n=1 Tax=Mesorhizobium xinjiangense TaxID=2678685 RepID=UPI0012EE724C|nr:acyltransferase [Mesorhizobium xinjiangense]